MLRSLAPVMRALGASLGPDERTVLSDFGGRVHQASSGVAIARESCASGGVAGIAPTLLKEILVEADRDLGDGTARLGVMVGAALRSGVASLAAGVDGGALARAAASLREDLDLAFRRATRSVPDLPGLARAAGADPALAQHLADAVERAGEAGQVEVFMTPGSGVEVIARTGFVFEATDLGAGDPGEMDDVHVIAADEILRDFGSLAPVIEGFATRGKALVIVARGLEGPALALIERNRKAGLARIAALTPRDVGRRAASIIGDLAAATGATVVSDQEGCPMSSLKPSMLGRASSYRRRGAQVELEAPKGAQEMINLRQGIVAGEIRANRHLALDREHAERRMARLRGAWVEVRVGRDVCSCTSDRVADVARRALATMAQARKEGVITGGGIGLDQIADFLEDMCSAASTEADRAARRMAAGAMRSVGQHLRRNSGDRYAGSVLANAPYDPTALSRVLLDQAMSAATKLLSLELAVVRH
ncbi:TCP-1/cpn60 chaperonin family protein [Rubellimicrobium aerolatum]|uniref:TCP-1/cpn60 chaperonin family protein n=1 Tax=Rubellimicrobium aerolatum TaxID=490979 RepID=A0ABW0SGM3_9RHOB|nr:TCP-1/cpn60 chaperonin family protein [Rubellimicrobium aerolatum]MBP1807505.1 chaperonin GroEL (HSP60 family) [Rubellimicrobium aerolatum]